MTIDQIQISWQKSKSNPNDEKRKNNKILNIDGEYEELTEEKDIDGNKILKFETIAVVENDEYIAIVPSDNIIYNPDGSLKEIIQNEIEEIEVSLTGKEYEVLKDNEKRVENITLQIHGGWAGKETKLLWETTLTKEEVEQIVYGEVLKVPVEIKEEEPEYVYVKVLFEHELLEGQQLMEAEAVPMDKGRVYTYAVLNLYYEYATVAWQQW